MESKHTDIETILIEQLERKGIEKNLFPLFIKDLNHSFSISDSQDVIYINNRLHVLGWSDFDLDYHTFQLAKAYFEN